MVHYHPSGRGSAVNAAIAIIGQKTRYSSQRLWRFIGVKNVRRSICGSTPYVRLGYVSFINKQHRILSLVPASSQRFFSGEVKNKEDEVTTTPPPPPQSLFQRIVSVVRTTVQSFTSSNVVAEQPASAIVPTNKAKDSASSFNEDAATSKIEPPEVSLNDFLIKDGVALFGSPLPEALKSSASVTHTDSTGSIAKSASEGEDPSSQRKMDFIRSKMAPLLNGTPTDTKSNVVTPVAPTTMVVPKVDQPASVASSALPSGVSPLNITSSREKQQRRPRPEPSTINLSDTISNLISQPKVPVMPHPLQTSKIPPRQNRGKEVTAALAIRLRSEFPAVPEMPFHIPDVNSWQQLPQQPKATKVKSWKAQRLRKQEKNRAKQQLEHQSVMPQQKVAVLAAPMPIAQSRVSSPTTPQQYNQPRRNGFQRNKPQALNPQAIHQLRSQLVEQVNNSRANAAQKQMSTNSVTTSSASGVKLNAIGHNPSVNVFRHRPELNILNHIRSRFPAKPSVQTPTPEGQPNPINAASVQQNLLNSIFSTQQQHSFEPNFTTSFNSPKPMIAPLPTTTKSAVPSDKDVTSVKKSDALAQLQSRLSEPEQGSPLDKNVVTAASINDVSFDRRNVKYTDAMERIRSRLPQVLTPVVEPELSPVPIFEPIPIQSSDAPNSKNLSSHPHSSKNSGLPTSQSFYKHANLDDGKSSHIPVDQTIRPLKSSSTFDVIGGLSQDNDFIFKLRSRLASQHKPEEPIAGLSALSDEDSVAVNSTSSSLYVNAMDRIRSKLPKSNDDDAGEHQSSPPLQDEQTTVDFRSTFQGIATSVSTNSDSSTHFNSHTNGAQQAQSQQSNVVDEIVNNMHQSELLKDSSTDAVLGGVAHSFDAAAFAQLRSRLSSHHDRQDVENEPGVDVVSAKIAVNDSMVASESSGLVNILDVVRAKYGKSDENAGLGQEKSSSLSDSAASEAPDHQLHTQGFGSVNLFDSAGSNESYSTTDEVFAQLKSRLALHNDPQQLQEPILPGMQEAQNNVDSSTASSDSLRRSNVIDRLRSQLPKSNPGPAIQEFSMASSDLNTSSVPNQPSLHGVAQFPHIRSEEDVSRQSHNFSESGTSTTNPSRSINDFDSAGSNESYSTNNEAFAQLKSRLALHNDPQQLQESTLPGIHEAQNRVDSSTASSDSLRRSNVIDRLRSQLPKSNPGPAIQEFSVASSDLNTSCVPNQPSLFSKSNPGPAIQEFSMASSDLNTSSVPNQSSLHGIYQFPLSESITSTVDQSKSTLAYDQKDQVSQRGSLEPRTMHVLDASIPNFENSRRSDPLPFSHGHNTGSEVEHAAVDMETLRKLRARVESQPKEPLKQTFSEKLFDQSRWGKKVADTSTYADLERLRARLPNWKQQNVPPFNAAKVDPQRSVYSNSDNSDDDAISKLQARVGQAVAGTNSIMDATPSHLGAQLLGFDDGSAAFRNVLHSSPDDDALVKLQLRLGQNAATVDNASIFGTAERVLQPQSQLQNSGTDSGNTAFADSALRNTQKGIERKDNFFGPFVGEAALNSRSANSNQVLPLYSSSIRDNSKSVYPSNVDVMDVMPSRQNSKDYPTNIGTDSWLPRDLVAPNGQNQFAQQKKVKSTVKQQNPKNSGQRKDMLDRISVGLSELIPFAKPQATVESRSPTIEPKARSALDDLRNKFLAAKQADSSAQRTQPGFFSMMQGSQRSKNLLRTSEHLPHLPNPSHLLERIFDSGNTRPSIQSHRERALQHQRIRFQDQSSISAGNHYDGIVSSSSYEKPPLTEIIRNLQYQNSLMSRSDGADGQKRNGDGSSSFDIRPIVVPRWRQSFNVPEHQSGLNPAPRSALPPAPRKPVFIDPKKQAISLPTFQISLTEASQLFREKTSRLIEILEGLGEARPEGVGEEDNESWMLSKETLELIAMEIGQLVEESTATTPSLSDEELLLMRRAAADAQPLAVSEEVVDYKSFPTRPPVVCIMGHVDHGKTTLMDALRRRAAKDSPSDSKKSKGKDKKKDKKKDKGKKASDKGGDVAGTEAGGITQVISAFEVPLIEQESGTSSVTFLDTPGHAAFTAMRQSGSDAADIIVLVIAADDGVSEQTVEILNFYKSIVKGAGSGGISLVVAMNKIDKPGIDVEEATRRIQSQLLEHGILTEGMPTSEGVTEYGPAVQMIPVSGLTGLGLDDLIEGLVLQSEMMDLRAPTDSGAEGIVMDARVDKGVGIVVDCIVRWGSLQKGDIVVSGSNKGKVRLLKDVKNAQVPKGLPSQPVRIVGFDSLPKAGDPFICVESEEAADELVSRRKAAEGAHVADTAPTPVNLRTDAELQSAGRHMMTHAWKDALETKYGLHPDEDGAGAAPVRIPVVIKADADGTLAAVRDSLVQLGQKSEHNVIIDPIKVGVGPLLPSEIQMAQECQASIVCFNIKNDQTVMSVAEENNVRILQSDIIYTLLDEAKLEFAKHLPEVPVEVVQGRGKVLAMYTIGGMEDKVAGLKVLEGTLFKDKTVATKGVLSAPCQYRVVRNGVPVATGLAASSLKHFKDDVTEVLRGKECGISLAGHNDYETGDEVECFSVEMRPATL